MNKKETHFLTHFTAGLSWYGNSIEFFLTYLQVTLYMVNRKTLHTHDLQYTFWSCTCHWHREAEMLGQTMI